MIVVSLLVAGNADVVVSCATAVEGVTNSDPDDSESLVERKKPDLAEFTDSGLVESPSIKQ